MSSSLPEGFSSRPATVEDAETVAAISYAAETAVRGKSNFSPGDIGAWWREVDLERDTWVIESDGRPIAAATLWAYGDAPTAWGDVHPDFVGRGVGTALVELTEGRARELGTETVRHDAFALDDRAARLFLSRGYREVRHHFEMRINFDDEPPPEARWPDGFTVESFRVEDAREFYDAQMEAFEDEWGFMPLAFDRWRELRLGSPDFDPSLWSVVREGSTIVAVARCDAHVYGGGWVGAIGVRKPWRRRGLGLALLQHTFRVFHARGERSVGLGVDTQNPTGATRLYERAGMFVEAESIAYEKQVK
jgi:mycothiol synthase